MDEVGWVPTGPHNLYKKVQWLQGRHEIVSRFAKWHIGMVTQRDGVTRGSAAGANCRSSKIRGNLSRNVWDDAQNTPTVQHHGTVRAGDRPGVAVPHRDKRHATDACSRFVGLMPPPAGLLVTVIAPYAESPILGTG